MRLTTMKLFYNHTYFIIFDQAKVPRAPSTTWMAFTSRKQLLSTYSTNTNNSLSAVLTTSLYFEAISEYNHCTVGPCCITPFMPSTYSITCATINNQNAKKSITHVVWCWEHKKNAKQRIKNLNFMLFDILHVVLIYMSARGTGHNSSWRS